MVTLERVVTLERSRGFEMNHGYLLRESFVRECKEEKYFEGLKRNKKCV